MKLTARESIEGLSKAAEREQDEGVKKVIEVAIKILKADDE